MSSEFETRVAAAQTLWGFLDVWQDRFEGRLGMPMLIGVLVGAAVGLAQRTALITREQLIRVVEKTWDEAVRPAPPRPN